MDNSEALEARLRVQQDQLVALEEELAEARSSAQVARREARVLRTRLTAPDEVPRREELAAGFAATGLEFSRMLTGILDDGHIHLVVRPVDSDADVVKLRGQLSVRVLDLSRPDGEQVLGKFSWSAAESAELWNSTGFGTGFVVDLPILELPRDAKVLLHARFEPGDGRQFDASHAIDVPAASTAAAVAHR